MFTGIITGIGKITASRPMRGDVQFSIDAGTFGLNDVVIGDSVAVNGCCLTTIDIDGNGFRVDLSMETLRSTTGMEVGAEVNLEKAMRMADRVGGHLVTGHVDGVGEVLRFEPVGESWLLRVRAPDDLARFIARKGSITLHGVSLTVNAVQDSEFEVNVIPHTLEVTTLKQLRPGTRLNLEVDLIARYVERIMTSMRAE